MQDERQVSPTPDARIDALLGRLTLAEKAALTVGRDAWTTVPVERLGIPSIWMADGPTGLRKARTSAEFGIGDSEPATCFPTESALAASWDVALVAEVARAIAREAQAAGVQVVLGPGVNLKRSPLAGRNFEYFSEDPLLSGRLAAAFIQGLQGEGVGASIKHFVANEHETLRMASDSLVDERTLREVYLRPFEIAVRESDPWTVMAAYNLLNGVSCCEHRELLHDILKEEWGYRGIVVSDWFAVNDRAAGIEAGLHLQMPGGPTAGQVVAAVEAGALAEARLDAVVRELLAFVLRADAARRPGTTADRDAHHALARRAAAASCVLLRNEGALLPLADERAADVALLGAFARHPRYQGSGSSQVTVDPARIETPEAALAAALGGVRYAPGYRDDHQPDDALLAEAVEVARTASAAIVLVGLPDEWETEGVDRGHIDLPPAHDALVEAVLAVQPHTVVVLIAGSAVRLPWAERVPALLLAGLAGQAAGGALADVLLGRADPAGRLAETWPRRLADTPAFGSFPGDGDGRTHFTERLFTGYRWYDQRAIEPRFPFGHGLSYTTFVWEDLTVDPPAADGNVTARVRVRNSGARAGTEVVQLYLSEVSPALTRPLRQLAGFVTLALAPGETGTATIELAAREFASWDPRVRGWRCAGGTFELAVGASSRDLRLSARVEIAPAGPPLPLGRRSPVAAWLAHPRGRALLEPQMAAVARHLGDAGADAWQQPMMQAVLASLPIGKLTIMGVLDDATLERLIAEANGG